MATVLVVEDDPDVGEVLILLIEAAGHQPVLARTGIEGLARCADLIPAVVLLDVSLPGGVTGLDVVRSLRADPVTRDVPVVLVSARAQPDDVAAGRRAGADDYLIKPFQPEQLQELLDHYVTDAGSAPA